MANKNLTAAKKAKNDEFYTRLIDIENELKHYKNHFEGKVVLCNCDDPVESNFFKYFVMNFNHLKLKGLIGIGYAGSPIAYTQLKFSNNDDGELIENTPDKPYVLEVTHLDGDPDAEQFREMVGRKKGKTGYWQVHRLRGDGDFRSEESVSYLKRADIVVTNPPFSLFREYVAQLVEYNKKFIIIGNKNAITYKEFFPLLKDNKVWIGYGAVKEFLKPDGTTQKFGNVGWYTNLDIAKRHENLILWKKYTPEEYPKYDNYDAINVDKVDQIPCDYDGVMGVPITFLDKYSPDQFEIIGMDLNDSVAELDIKPIGEDWVNLYRSQGGKGHITANMHSLVYTQNGKAVSLYRRILICRRML